MSNINKLVQIYLSEDGEELRPGTTATPKVEKQEGFLSNFGGSDNKNSEPTKPLLPPNLNPANSPPDPWSGVKAIGNTVKGWFSSPSKESQEPPSPTIVNKPPIDQITGVRDVRKEAGGPQAYTQDKIKTNLGTDIGPSYKAPQNSTIWSGDAAKQYQNDKKNLEIAAKSNSQKPINSPSTSSHSALNPKREERESAFSKNTSGPFKDNKIDLSTPASSAGEDNRVTAGKQEKTFSSTSTPVADTRSESERKSDKLDNLPRVNTGWNELYSATNYNPVTKNFNPPTSTPIADTKSEPDVKSDSQKPMSPAGINAPGEGKTAVSFKSGQNVWTTVKNQLQSQAGGGKVSNAAILARVKSIQDQNPNQDINKIKVGQTLKGLEESISINASVQEYFQKVK